MRVMPRRVRQAREVARRRRLTDADEADVVVAHRAGGGDGQHLVAGAGPCVHAACARALANASGPAHDVLVEPRREAVAGARDLLPLLVEGVVARRSSRRRTREVRRPARPRWPRCVQRGRMQAFAPAPSKASTTSSTVTTARRAASAASFCTPMIPSMRTLPSRSAFWAWMMVTSGRSAGTAVSVSPVNGQVTVR